MKQTKNFLSMILTAVCLLLLVTPAFPAPIDEARVDKVKMGKDKNATEETDEYGQEDTIYAVAAIVNNRGTVKVKGRLIAVEIPGVKAGPIPGLEVIVTVTGNRYANFSFTKPTKGWPKGEYEFEAVLLDENGEEGEGIAINFGVS